MRALPAHLPPKSGASCCVSIGATGPRFRGAGQVIATRSRPSAVQAKCQPFEWLRGRHRTPLGTPRWLPRGLRPTSDVALPADATASLGVAGVAIVPHVHFSGPLSDDAEQWLRRTVELLARLGEARRAKPRRRLQDVFLLKGIRQPLNSSPALAPSLCFSRAVTASVGAPQPACGSGFPELQDSTIVLEYRYMRCPGIWL